MMAFFFTPKSYVTLKKDGIVDTVPEEEEAISDEVIDDSKKIDKPNLIYNDSAYVHDLHYEKNYKQDNYNDNFLPNKDLLYNNDYQKYPPFGYNNMGHNNLHPFRNDEDFSDYDDEFSSSFSHYLTPISGKPHNDLKQNNNYFDNFKIDNKEYSDSDSYFNDDSYDFFSQKQNSKPKDFSQQNWNANNFKNFDYEDEDSLSFSDDYFDSYSDFDDNQYNKDQYSKDNPFKNNGNLVFNSDFGANLPNNLNKRQSLDDIINTRRNALRSENNLYNNEKIDWARNKNNNYGLNNSKNIDNSINNTTTARNDMFNGNYAAAPNNNFSMDFLPKNTKRDFQSNNNFKPEPLNDIFSIDNKSLNRKPPFPKQKTIDTKDPFFTQKPNNVNNLNKTFGVNNNLMPIPNAKNLNQTSFAPNSLKDEKPVTFNNSSQNEYRGPRINDFPSTIVNTYDEDDVKVKDLLNKIITGTKKNITDKINNKGIFAKKRVNDATTSTNANLEVKNGTAPKANFVDVNNKAPNSKTVNSNEVTKDTSIVANTETTKVEYVSNKTTKNDKATNTELSINKEAADSNISIKSDNKIENKVDTATSTAVNDKKEPDIPNAETNAKPATNEDSDANKAFDHKMENKKIIKKRLEKILSNRKKIIRNNIEERISKKFNDKFFGSFLDNSLKEYRPMIQETQQKQVTNTESTDKKEDDDFYSPVVEFTSCIPKDSYNNDYQKIKKELYCEPSREITDDDLLSIIKNNPYLESLDISNCDNLRDFSILNKLNNLKELNVNNCDFFINLDDISGCKNLRVLNIGNTPIRNIDAVKNFRELRVLNCACNSITDINALENCQNLTEAIFWNCFSLQDISALGTLYNLRLLDIDSTSVSDIFSLANCYNIEFLFMDNCNKIDDIFALSALKKLRCLLFDNKNILMPEQAEALSELVNIEYLTLSGRRVVDARPFSKMLKMKELTLNGCNISDLSPLEYLTDMRKIDLTANSNLRDLSPLAGMKELNKLLVGGGGSVAGKVGSAKGAATSSMNIEDISVVENFSKLTEVDLNTNSRLKDIRSLEAAVVLEEINLSKCTQLCDVSVLGKLSKLKKINLTSCPKIKDLYFLRNLPSIEELRYNGTIVHTPGLVTILRRCNGIFVLQGNDADILSQTTLVSGKKKTKLTKAFAKYFKNTDNN